MEKLLKELENLQRSINFNNYLIRSYNTFLAEKGLSEEWAEFLIKYKEDKPTDEELFKDIKPIVKLLDEFVFNIINNIGL